MKCIEVLEFDGKEYRKGDIIKVKALNKEPIVGKLIAFCNSDLDLDCSDRFESKTVRYVGTHLVTIERVDENEKVSEQSREE